MSERKIKTYKEKLFKPFVPNTISLDYSYEFSKRPAEELIDSVEIWLNNFTPIISKETMSLHYWKSYMGYTDKYNDLWYKWYQKEYPNRKTPTNLNTVFYSNFWRSMGVIQHGTVYKTFEGDKTYTDFKNNAGGYWNHYIFFSNLLMYNGNNNSIKAFDQIPATEIGNYLQSSHILKDKNPILTLPMVEAKEFTLLNVLITAQYGSVNGLRNEIITKGLSVFGSGWVWVLRKNVKDAKTHDWNNAFTVITTKNQDNPFMSSRYKIDGGRTDYTVVCCIDLWEHAYYREYEANRLKYIKNVLKITNIGRTEQALKRYEDFIFLLLREQKKTYKIR